MAASFGQAQASIIFAFTESGGNVLMQSNGVLNIANLVSVTASGCGGTGVETNDSPDPDIMGDTSMGSLDAAFTFSAGTDTSAWVGDMFTNYNFGWASVGTTQFSTYYREDGVRTPGVALKAADMVGSLWTPDVYWTKAGTLASLGLTQGVYTITDAQTAESISIQIGDRVSVPEPASIAMLGMGCLH